MFINKKKRRNRVIDSMISSDDFLKDNPIPNSPQREKIKICFIDDEGYYSLDKLQSLGYKDTTVKYQFNSLDEFDSFNVIFCDIQGIGSAQYPTNKGFDVAVELKKRYPNCCVFIYTGIDSSNYPAIPSDIKLVSKQTQLKDIVAILDKECEKFWNPVAAWKEIESKMREEQMPNKFIALLEDDFYQSAISGNNEISNDSKIEKQFNFEKAKFYITTAISIIDIILKIRG